MVNNLKDCVLQRAGHAGYVAERFSGLFARQSLVDVTLVCEEQKLRVHKLVLASNSVYFEEILQEDLGREPIIFLKDLNFEILKAMVEFMYCGETTIPQHLLPPLLAATKTFQIKELTSVINAMMTSNAASEDLKIIVNGETDSYRSMIATTSGNDTKYMHVKCSELEKEECDLLCGKSNSDMSTNDTQSLENNTSIDVTEHELEPTLYEESQRFERSKAEICTLLVTSDPAEIEEDHGLIKPAQCKLKDVPNRCSESSTVSDDLYSTDDELKPMLYEQCCDFSDVDECDKTVSLSRSCLQQIEKDFAQYSFNSTDVPSKVGKCVKVYSHKRRKSADDVKSKIVDMNNVIPNPPSTDCIDLLDEPSTNDIPVTLLTSLDMESAEYIISLSTENIQSIVGATVSEQHTLIKCKDINHLINYNQKENVSKKQLSSGSSENPTYIKPILRRSLRLNQQESEEAVNNNESTGEPVTGEKPFKKSNSPNRIEICGRGRRKTKDADRKVPEQSNNNNNQAHNSKRNCNNSRTHKNTTKLIVKKNNKSTFTTSSKEKDESKLKANKMKCEAAEKAEANSTLFTQAKLNTIEHINRALWGDMSDISEECECTMDLQEHTPHAEIPFAVGLLPLRTALEKMQATPDYQPRKTRSSVAPIRYDASSLKRKSNSLDSAVISKKQNTSGGEPKQDASTVCHIRIRAAPSQYIRNRKKSISEDMALAAATIANRQ